MEEWGRFSLSPSIGSCTIIDDIHGRSPKKVLFIGAFLLPGLAIIICYARIFWIVKKVGKNSRAPIPMRPRTVTGANDTKSRDSTGPDLGAANGHQKRAYTLHCLSTPSSENSSYSCGESTYQEDCDKKPPPNENRRMSNNEAVRKLKHAFTNLRQPAPQKPLLPTKKDKKLRTMIMAIMLSFGLCHLPISVTKIFLEFTFHPALKIVSYILLYLTTCINPIIYVVMSNEYRQAYKNLVMCRPQSVEQESTAMRIINGINKSFRRSEKKVKLKNTQEDNV